jgi:hypothetical protein
VYFKWWSFDIKKCIKHRFPEMKSKKHYIIWRVLKDQENPLYQLWCNSQNCSNENQTDQWPHWTSAPHDEHRMETNTKKITTTSLISYSIDQSQNIEYKHSKPRCASWKACQYEAKHTRPIVQISPSKIL